MEISEKKKIILLILLTIVLRFIPAVITPVSGDLKNSFVVNELIFKGDDPYLSGVCSNPPLWLWWGAGAFSLGQFFHLPFQLVIKVPMILADILICLLIYQLVKDKKLRFVSALFYSLNPVSILVTGFHGQFDSFVILTILLAIKFFRSPKKWLSPFSLGLGIALKSFPVLIGPVFLLKKKKIKEKIIFAFWSALPIFLILLPFLFKYSLGSAKYIFGYSGITDFGWMAIIRAINWLSHGQAFLAIDGFGTLLSWNKIGFLALYGFLFLWLIKKKKDLIFAWTIIFTAFYLFYGGISSQYLVWILPFLIIIDLKMAIYYSFFACLAMASFYSFFFPSMFLWLIPGFVSQKILNSASVDLAFASQGLGTAIPLFGLTKTALTTHLIFLIFFWLFIIRLFVFLVKRK